MRRFSLLELKILHEYVNMVVKDDFNFFKMVSFNQKQAQERYEKYLKGNDDTFNEITKILKDNSSWFKDFIK